MIENLKRPRRKTRVQAAAILVLGATMALPGVLTLTSLHRALPLVSELSASGYNVTAGITGEIICDPGGNDDCPD